MTTQTVSSGAVSSNLTVTAGNELDVLDGGTVGAIAIASGGIQVVEPGGSGSYDTVGAGGLLIVSSGATEGTAAAITTVSSGGVAIVIPGAAPVLSGSGAIVSGGVALVSGAALVSAGASLTGAVVGAGETAFVLPTGSAVQLTISSAGLVDVYSGGTASAAAIRLDGTQTVYDGGAASFTTVSTAGTELVSSGGTASFTVVSAGAQVVFTGGVADFTAVSNSGAQYVFSGAVVDATTVSAGGVQYVFSAGVANFTTVSAGAAEFVFASGTATGTDLLVGGTLDLVGVRYAAGGTASLDAATDILTITEAGSSTAEQLSGNYTGQSFQLAEDALGGTEVTVGTVACYCRGTRIRTERDEVPVEALRIGDRLLTVSGKARPIRWIGTRSYAGRFARMNPAVQPVCIAAGALADGVPARDLMVSPKHAMFLDGMLIPAACLLNGTTIRRVTDREVVEYYHLELDSHDVILAEGAPSETFVDDDSRGMFHNAAAYGALYPDVSPGEAVYYAPRVEAGFALEAIRRALAVRAGQKRGVAA